jgi:putative Ca2+/H+ antiporter (TMEM165/GDT1 family)
VSETYLGVVLIAFGAQLAVLPGEKVQFIIAGLATRFHPLLVVSAAGTAFAGWTVLEVALGRTLQQYLPPTVLALLSGAMFLLFAVLLYRSAPDSGESPTETDGGTSSIARTGVDVTVFGREVPNYLGGFVPIFAMMAVGEFGDKTQLVTIDLALQYGGSFPSAIWLGEMLAIIPVSLANAYFFSTFTQRFDLRKAHFFSAGLFGFFAMDTFLGVATGWLFGESFTVWETVVGVFADVVLSVL